MRAGGGHYKGSAFERKIGRKLSLWLTGGRDGTQLVRTRGSGAFRKGKKERGEEPWRQAGDLGPNGPSGDQFRRGWLVECKNRQKVELWSLWTDNRSPESSLLGWWAKLSKEASGLRLRPMLVVHQNRKPIMVILPAVVLTRWGADGWVVPAKVTKIAHFSWLSPPAIMFPFKDLVEHCAADYFMSGYLIGKKVEGAS